MLAFVFVTVILCCSSGTISGNVLGDSGSFTPAVLARLIDQYAKLSSTHLTGTPADHATSEWISKKLAILGLDVQYQSYALPGPPVWIPYKDGLPSSGYGCQLIVDARGIPCYIVQQPPLGQVSLQNIPMNRVLIVHMADVYMFKAKQAYDRFVRPDGVLPYDVAIVINAKSAENVTQPRPFDWNQSDYAPPTIPVVTVSYLFQELLLGATNLTSLRLLGHRISHATSRNVLAKLQGVAPMGCDPALGPPWPIYIGTPINGFFEAAGERGAGIAMLISLARDFASRPLHCNNTTAVGDIQPHSLRCRMPIFGFTSGHEQNDPGILVGVIPYLQELAVRLNISLAEIPFVSVGANVGIYANHDGQNFAGAGFGTAPLYATTSSHDIGDGAARAMLDELASNLGREDSVRPFLHAAPGVMNITNTGGAVVQALQSGMAALNLVGMNTRGRFHLPTDAGVSSVNLTSLLSVTVGMSKALRTAMCASSSSSISSSDSNGFDKTAMFV